MRTIDRLRSIAEAHPRATELAASLGAAALVLAVTVAQWGANVDGVLRGLALGTWAGIVVYLVARRRRVARETAVREALGLRLDIARELHDTVAGAVAGIGIQAGAARRALRERPDEATAALERIEAASRAANADLRRMLIALRGDGSTSTAPEPGLDQLEALVAETRLAGPDVRLALDPGVLRIDDPARDHAAYRIVQEALTNVVRHAGSAPVDVNLGIGAAGSLEIEVVNGAGSGSTAGPGAGLGILGMRERAATFGGSLVAGPTPGGGYAVRASLPRSGPS